MVRKLAVRFLSIPLLTAGLAVSAISPFAIAADDTFIVQRGIVGKGEGNDIYVLSSSLIDTNAQITISDTQGSNSLQLIGGLSITSSIVASDTVQLTLNNGAIVTVLGAGSMSYTLGGDPLNGTAGSSKNYQSFVSDALGTSVPVTGTVSGGSSLINADGSAEVSSVTDGGEGAGGGYTEIDFTVVTHSDIGFESMNRKIEVFGIPIYAASGVDESRLVHAAHIMAQYLDNDENGVIDNQPVLDRMLAAKSYLFMWKTESDIESFNPPDGMEGQDLGNDETIPEWHTNGHQGQFDAALEEVWHLITHNGYSAEYPNVFGESVGTSLANAMDIARGGQFIAIPSSYPDSAWYSYDDESCDYACMATEYFYWGMTSVLGAQSGRLSEIQEEWRLNTPALMQSTDTALYNLLTDSQYKLPTVLPDGSYNQ